MIMITDNSVLQALVDAVQLLKKHRLETILECHTAWAVLTRASDYLETQIAAELGR